MRVLDLSFGQAIVATAYSGEAAVPLPWGLPVMLPDTCSVIGAFVRMWSDAASSDEARGAQLAPAMRLTRARTRATADVTAKRMKLVVGWGKKRFDRLFEFSGESPMLLQRQEGIVNSAVRGYGGTLFGLTAAWLAPPIDSPCVPDVALALRGALTQASVSDVQGRFIGLAHDSLIDACRLVNDMVEMS